jgi:hypothetical protein
VGTVEGTLGQALLMLIGLAILMFVVILVLTEANLILGLVDKLVHRWRTGRSASDGIRPGGPARPDPERPRDGQGVQ